MVGVTAAAPWLGAPARRAGVGRLASRARRIYPPSVVVAGLTVGVVAVAVDRLVRAGSLRHVLAAGRAELLTPAIGGLVLLAVVCEQRWPAEAQPTLSRGRLQDVVWTGVHVAVVVPLMTLLGVGFAIVLGEHLSWLDGSWTAAWPSWVLVPVTLVAMDAANWLAHLADHRVPPLWRLHTVHHSQEELSVLTSFRAHPLMHTSGFFVSTVAVLAMMGDRSLAPTLVTGYVCLGTLPHANVRWTFGRLGKVIVSPAYHRRHHSADGELDVNLAVVLPLWDMLAGRARFPDGAAGRYRTGLAGRPVTVEQAGSYLRPVRVLTRQLVEPFLRQPGGIGLTAGSGEQQDGVRREPVLDHVVAARRVRERGGRMVGRGL
jgi:sterol desaturase/sphingolipid hydroxylase (fatty acid hydroxylase superfamily)